MKELPNRVFVQKVSFLEERSQPRGERTQYDELTTSVLVAASSRKKAKYSFKCRQYRGTSAS